jgi:hypothetical protein
VIPIDIGVVDEVSGQRRDGSAGITLVKNDGRLTAEIGRALEPDVEAEAMYMLPLFEYQSPSSGWWPLKPMVRKPSFEKLPGASQISSSMGYMTKELS